MTPEDEFEAALQKYISACAEYKLAITQYVRDVGMDAAMPKLREAEDRQCLADKQYLSQEEIDLRASRAKPIVDADKDRAMSGKGWLYKLEKES